MVSTTVNYTLINIQFTVKCFMFIFTTLQMFTYVWVLLYVRNVKFTTIYYQYKKNLFIFICNLCFTKKKKNQHHLETVSSTGCNCVSMEQKIENL